MRNQTRLNLGLERVPEPTVGYEGQHRSCIACVEQALLAGTPCSSPKSRALQSRHGGGMDGKTLGGYSRSTRTLQACQPHVTELGHVKTPGGCLAHLPVATQRVHTSCSFC